MEVTLISIENSPSLIFPVMQEMIIKKGHKCKYLHVALQNKDREFFRKISDQIINLSKDSKLIGISCMTNTFPASIALIKNLKSAASVPIILGGVHPTVKPLDCLKYADYVCVGEGEEPLLELIDRISKNKRTDNIKNIWTKGHEGEPIVAKRRALIKNLNSLPVPNFDMKNVYSEHNGVFHCLARRKDLIKKFYSKYYYIITSRGCPYRCKYCLNDALIKVDQEFRVIRRRSTEHIIRELNNAKEILPRGTIIGFVDDDFCAQSEENLKKFCEIYKKEIEMPFFCASTPTSMNEEKIKCLIDAGLVRLEIGVQTISDRINKEVFGRFASREQVIKVVKMLNKYRRRIQICYDFILDNPWENESTRLETLNFILNLKKPYTASLFSLTNYPGTDLYNRAKKEGIIKNDSEIYRKNHMLLENDRINTLFVLYTKYGFPAALIKLLINARKLPFINYGLGHSTRLLWRMYNYYFGLKDSISRGDKDLISYYLLAPFRYLGRKMIFRPKIEPNSNNLMNKPVQKESDNS